MHCKAANVFFFFSMAREYREKVQMQINMQAMKYTYRRNRVQKREAAENKHYGK